MRFCSGPFDCFLLPQFREHALELAAFSPKVLLCLSALAATHA